MVLTNAQTNAFFTDPAQMGIPDAIVEALEQEGIGMVDDLAEFNKTLIEAITANFCRPAVGLPLVFGAKSQTTLIVACDLVCFYKEIGRNITPANLQWDSVVRNFEIQWKAWKEKKKEDEPATPKITKGLNVMRWSVSFEDVLHCCIGARMTPLAYVVCEQVEVQIPAPDSMASQPHSVTAGLQFS